jgi:hypothetical protein
VNLNDAEFELLGRVKAAAGRLPADDLDDAEQEAAKRLVYLGYLARVDDRLVLTPAGAQVLNHNHP